MRVLDTLNYLQRLTSYRINWRSHSEQYLDSTGIFRQAVVAILAAVAKQERIRISERTRAGLDRAREKGTRSGKPIGWPRLVIRRDQVVPLSSAPSEENIRFLLVVFFEGQWDGESAKQLPVDVVNETVQFGFLAFELLQGVFVYFFGLCVQEH